MQTDLATLKQLVIETAKKSPVGEKVEGVELESDRDDEGTDFLRVMVRLRNSDKSDDQFLADMLQAIESIVGEHDERYPSVRFLDAA